METAYEIQQKKIQEILLNNKYISEPSCGSSKCEECEYRREELEKLLGEEYIYG